MSSTGLIVLETVVGGVTLNPALLGATTGAGLFLKTALRGGQFHKNEFIKEMNLTDDTIVDFGPLITQFEKQYNKTFLTA